MNAPTPLIREGMKPFRGKSTFYYKFFLILTVHVIVIGGLLLQGGCKDPSIKEPSTAPPAPAPALPTSAVNVDPALLAQMRISFSNTVAIQPQPPRQQPQVTQPPKALPQTATVDTALYIVKAGDTLGKIAKAHHTTAEKIKALNALKSASLKVNQKLKLPAAKAA
jgi:LysM repeat protein